MDILHDSIILSIDEFKSLIAGNFKTFRCLQCDGTGCENWNEDGDDVRPGYSSSNDRENGSCEVCRGIGYKIHINL